MKEYNLYYRQRGNKQGEEFSCIVTVSSKKKARENFEQWDNQDKKWTITRIERS